VAEMLTKLLTCLYESNPCPGEWVEVPFFCHIVIIDTGLTREIGRLPSRAPRCSCRSQEETY